MNALTEASWSECDTFLGAETRNWIKAIVIVVGKWCCVRQELNIRMSCARIECKPINYRPKKESSDCISALICLHTGRWVKRYTFAIGTFTCLIIGFHSRCVDIAGKKPIDCTHCFSSIINFLHERGEERRESACSFSFSTYTKVGCELLHRRVPEQSLGMAPMSRMDQARVPESVFDCSSWQRHCSARKRGDKGAKRQNEELRIDSFDLRNRTSILAHLIKRHRRSTLFIDGYSLSLVQWNEKKTLESVRGNPSTTVPSWSLYPERREEVFPFDDKISRFIFQLGGRRTESRLRLIPLITENICRETNQSKRIRKFLFELRLT